MRLDQESIGKISAFIAENVASNPVIIRDGAHSIRVNDWVITEEDASWKVSRRGKNVRLFSYKAWALAFAVAQANNDSSISSYLASNEDKLNRLKVDREIYNHHLRQATIRGDEVKINIIEGRLSRTEQEMFELMDEAQQVLLYQRI